MEYIETAKGIIKAFIAMAGAEGVSSWLILFWFCLALSAAWVPWSSPMREYIEDFSNCFFVAAILSILCGAYQDGVIGKYALAAGAVVFLALLVAEAKANAAKAERARKEAGGEPGKAGTVQANPAMPSADDLTDTLKEVLDKAGATIKEIWEQIKDMFKWW